MVKKPKASINLDAVKRDVKKVAKSIVSNSSPEQGYAEFSPGTVKRESPLEQRLGPGKYRSMIHDHNEKNKHVLDRLPFTFPRKKVVRSHLNISVECPECGHIHGGSENTVGFICSGCKKYVSVYNPEAESRGYDPDLKVGIFGTAMDKLRLKEKKAKKY